MNVRTAACALVTFGIPFCLSVTAQACDALGTSRVLKLDTNTTAGFGQSFPALGLVQGEVVLTFDDGPAPDTTAPILDILARDCIRATFFMIGKRAEAEPELVRHVRAGGHTIGSHSYSHRRLDTLPLEQAAGDIERGIAAVETAVSVPTREKWRGHLFRFPEYKSTPELIAFVRSRGAAVASWSLSSEDWRGQPPEVTMERVRRLLERRGRGVLSFHDNQKNTVALLPMVIAELRARRMKIVHLETQ
jgi:peptidoglycan-N-acetylglucosamine deacetylase